jgi:hypothetical protein
MRASKTRTLAVRVFNLVLFARLRVEENLTGELGTNHRGCTGEGACACVGGIFYWPVL